MQSFFQTANWYLVGNPKGRIIIGWTAGWVQRQCALKCYFILTKACPCLRGHTQAQSLHVLACVWESVCVWSSSTSRHRLRLKLFTETFTWCLAFPLRSGLLMDEADVSTFPVMSPTVPKGCLWFVLPKCCYSGDRSWIHCWMGFSPHHCQHITSNVIKHSYR